MPYSAAQTDDYDEALRTSAMSPRAIRLILPLKVEIWSRRRIEVPARTIDPSSSHGLLVRAPHRL